MDETCCHKDTGLIKNLGYVKIIILKLIKRLTGHYNGRLYVYEEAVARSDSRCG